MAATLGILKGMAIIGVPIMLLAAVLVGLGLWFNKAK